jgi:hypothetical protein
MPASAGFVIRVVRHRDLVGARSVPYDLFGQPAAKRIAVSVFLAAAD